MKSNWKKILIPHDATVRTAIEAIDRGGLHIGLVIDPEGRLVGVVSDGDVRRAILQGIDLTQSVRSIMTANPRVVHAEEGRDAALKMMNAAGVTVLPILDASGRPVGLETLPSHMGGAAEGSWAVLMAGGFGRRLAPLTDSVPKPLINVGAKPILQIIVENLAKHGFQKIFISVNYRADQIKNHFGDGSAWNVEIDYLEETDPLGTAGSLSLLRDRPETSLLVMNADLLTALDFTALLEFHRAHDTLATMCVREHQVQLQYGVAEADGVRLLSLVEKPVYKMHVNAGVYVLSPAALEFIPHGIYFDMPSLLSKLIEQDKHPTVFPIREYWLDIGRFEDLERAQNDIVDLLIDRGSV